MLKDDIKEIMIDEEKIKEIVSDLGRRISEDYAGKEILMVVVLKGSVIFAADLMRYIDVPVKLDFLQASSYGSGTKSSGIINIKRDLENDVMGRHVLIIEDIVDSGNTLAALKRMMSERQAASVKICSFLSKPSRREQDIEIEYIGMDIPDEFVVGYGMDFNEAYRQLPYVGVLKPQVYASV
ncbi:MAG: hypoxanthine phosphoribosyltransferase [Clostridiales bacterium]|nr:hypoxanthine phosphoribosyltransferase [Clostridiales bacterium]